MDDKSLTCEACGGKVLANPEEMDQHKKDAHGGEAQGGSEGGGDHDHKDGEDNKM